MNSESELDNIEIEIKPLSQLEEERIALDLEENPIVYSQKSIRLEELLENKSLTISKKQSFEITNEDQKRFDENSMSLYNSFILSKKGGKEDQKLPNNHETSLLKTIINNNSGVSSRPLIKSKKSYENNTTEDNQTKSRMTALSPIHTEGVKRVKNSNLNKEELYSEKIEVEIVKEAIHVFKDNQKIEEIPIENLTNYKIADLTKSIIARNNLNQTTFFVIQSKLGSALRFKEAVAHEGDGEKLNQILVQDDSQSCDQDELLMQMQRFSSIYKEQYLNVMDNWMMETIHQMDLRHEAEMNELKRLQIEQKQTLIEDMNRRRERIRKIKIRMENRASNWLEEDQ